MSGSEFEKTIAEHYRKTGSKSRVTGGANDYAVDVVAISEKEKLLSNVSDTQKEVG